MFIVEIKNKIKKYEEDFESNLNKDIQIMNVLKDEWKLEENKLKELKLNIPSSTLKLDDKIMTIIFISYDEDIHYSIICKKKDNFSKIESLLYDRYPEYKNLNAYFIVNGNIINKDKTLEDNQINFSDIITVKIN